MSNVHREVLFRILEKIKEVKNRELIVNFP